MRERKQEKSITFDVFLQEKKKDSFHKKRDRDCERE
jgi:hypothetical protein